jgi:hypothetical protein
MAMIELMGLYIRHIRHTYGTHTAQ